MAATVTGLCGDRRAYPDHGVAMTLPDIPDVGTRTAIASVARDLVLFLARIGRGVLMVAHAKLEYDFAGGSIAGVAVDLVPAEWIIGSDS